jgi:NADPH:quinone reductase-like Zn-dependent oxidoreductase
VGRMPPLVLGVEAAGSVLAVGSSVQSARVGDAFMRILSPCATRAHGRSA